MRPPGWLGGRKQGKKTSAWRTQGHAVDLLKVQGFKDHPDLLGDPGQVQST